MNKLTDVISVRTTKTVYRDKDYAIKLFDELHTAADVLNEAHNHAIVQETGFCAPAIHEVTKFDGKWAIVMDHIEGKTLLQLMSEQPDKLDQLFERFVGLQLDMHSYTDDRLRHHTDKMHDKINKCGLDATTRYELHMRLNGLPRHTKLCHGDFTPGNVIITPDDKAYVIDWSHATQGNASADAARTYLRFQLAKMPEHAEKYLELFCKKSDTAKQYVQKWMAIVAASRLVKCKPAERDTLNAWTSVVEYE